MTLDQRAAGVLLHPTSLPGRFGIGDLGPGCVRFLDWMRDAGLALWQVLPLGPTSYGDSPYQCFSAFAGNPLLVSPDRLAEAGLATPEDLQAAEHRGDRVDYGRVIETKTHLLRLVYNRFNKKPAAALAKQYEAFRANPINKTWLDDYALFRVCKDLHGGQSWDRWDAKLRRRDPKALEKIRKQEAEGLDFHRFAQFLFFHQWEAIRAEARQRGISIIGDAPIYVAYDSADTWANQEIFLLDREGLPTEVAGVPPDYFSATGQLWGNPLYNWPKLAETGYQWWLDRMAAIFATVDVVRLDHFRGFMGYWAVPFGEKTAVNGKWRRGPGADFFRALKKKFRNLPIIAEDLGEITPDVIAVRDEFKLPGMKILQFAWGAVCTDPLIPDPNSQFRPHNHVPNSVVYTGTHDNDTTLGWWQHGATPTERTMMQVYLATDGRTPHWDLTRAAFHSVANTAIVPMQDFLGLGSDCRMNLPGRAEGNWAWRLREDQLNPDLARHIRSMTLLGQRCSNPPDVALLKHDPEKENYLAEDDAERAAAAARAKPAAKPKPAAPKAKAATPRKAAKS
jgi:4-alpha-glucanotransferase